MPNELPPSWFLHQCFKYEADGKLVWRSRPPEHFISKRAWRIFSTSFTGKEAGTQDSGYRAVTIRGSQFAGRYLVHRVIWKMHKGCDPTELIDHANCDKRDNRIENLREATLAQNACNQTPRADNKSGFKGVSFHSQRRKWRAYISSNGRQRSLGLFDTKEAAHVAYRAAAKECHSEFANFQTRERA
jgi:hypothetical protein